MHIAPILLEYYLPILEMWKYFKASVEKQHQKYNKMFDDLKVYFCRKISILLLASLQGRRNELLFGGTDS